MPNHYAWGVCTLPQFPSCNVTGVCFALCPIPLNSNNEFWNWSMCILLQFSASPLYIINTHRKSVVNHKCEHIRIALVWQFILFMYLLISSLVFSWSLKVDWPIKTNEITTNEKNGLDPAIFFTYSHLIPLPLYSAPHLFLSHLPVAVTWLIWHRLCAPCGCVNA